MEEGASETEAFTLLLRLLMTHCDRVDMGEGCTELYTFGEYNGTPFCDFSREFRVLLYSADRYGERACFSPGTDVVLEVVRKEANEQFPTLLPTLYPGSKATNPGPYVSLDAMWRACSDLAHNKTPAVNAKHVFLCLFLRRERGHPPRRGADPPVMGAARAECRPSRFRGSLSGVIARVNVLWSGWSQPGTHVGDRRPSVQWLSQRMRMSGIADLTERVSCRASSDLVYPL